MTCVVGLKDSGRVLVGADTCVTYPSHRDSTDDKLFKVGPFIVGGAGDALLMQYVEHGLKFKAPKEISLASFAKKTLAPKIAEIWTNLQQLDEDIWGEFLFAYKAEMVSITARGEVLGTQREYLAIGSGSSFAMGSLRNSRGKAEDRIIQAINTAAEFLGDVAPPIRLVTT